MRKFIALMFSLVLMAFGAILAIAFEIDSNKNTVTHSENVIWGDPSFADGATVQSISHYNNHLVWNSVYTVGGNTQTDYKFHFGKYYSNSRPKLSGFIIHTDISYGFNSTVPASEQYGIARVYKELYDSLDYDEQGSMTIRLADYYDYYPISININLPTLFWNATSESFSRRTGVISTLSDQNDQKIYEDICEFFKIPVLETEYIDITVTKHRGNSIGFGHGWSDKAIDQYNLNTHSTYTDKVCYLSINNRTEKGKIMDFSNIPGGYGIYAMPYEGTQLKSDKLLTVYALDESTIVNHMTVSNDASKLLLTVVENGASYFEVIDIATMTQLQKFKINDGSHYIVYPNDGFIVYEFENHVAVIEEKDGKYSLAFVTNKFFSEHTDKEYFYFRSGAALDFDGARLIVVDNILTDQTWYDKCGFFIAVYNNEGLQYFGEYESSLDKNLNAERNYGFNCRPLGNFKVRWENK